MTQLISSILKGFDNRQMPVDLRFDNQISNQPVVIFVHGFKGFKDWGHFPKVGEEMVKAGFAFVSFNFTHDGTTLEKPSEFTDLEAFGNNNYNKELFDTEQVIQGISDRVLFSEAKLNRDKIYLLGHSRGGGVSITKAAENKLVKGLVTWASVGDMKRTNTDLEEWKKNGVVYIPNARTNQEMPLYYQFVEDALDQEQRYNLESSCDKIEIPSLFIHGTNDKTVDSSDAGNLADWCASGEKLMIEDGDHVFGGRHPFKESELPEHTKQALSATIDHFKKIG
jgi:dienelactone hydrolase